MNKILSLFIALLLSSMSFTLQAAVKGEEISYKAGDTTLKGYMAWDDAHDKKRPGILVVHEWWGHNDYARKRADMLAEQGYTALAVDMYGDGKQAEHPKQAKEFMSAVTTMQGVAKERFEAALATLKKHPTVASDDIAAVGYCFGGGVVLQMARSGLDLDMVASFHGGLSTKQPAEKDKVKAEILVFHGEDDKMITADQVDTFKKEMDSAKVKYTFVGYPKASHGFTNPDADKAAEKFSLPVGYNKEADEKSWAQLLADLKSRYAQ